jgi:hypothetical protein
MLKRSRNLRKLARMYTNVFGLKDRDKEEDVKHGEREKK